MPICNTFVKLNCSQFFSFETHYFRFRWLKFNSPTTSGSKSCSKAAWCAEIAINFSEIPWTIASIIRTIKNVRVVPSWRHFFVLQQFIAFMPQSTWSKKFIVQLIYSCVNLLINWFIENYNKCQDIPSAPFSSGMFSRNLSSAVDLIQKRLS